MYPACQHVGKGSDVSIGHCAVCQCQCYSIIVSVNMGGGWDNLLELDLVGQHCDM